MNPDQHDVIHKMARENVKEYLAVRAGQDSKHMFAGNITDDYDYGDVPSGEDRLTVSDPVNPDHYSMYGDLQPADVIAMFDFNFFEGCVFKYLARAPHKGSQLKDYEKGIRYFQILHNIASGKPTLHKWGEEEK